MNAFFKDETSKLYLADSLELLKNFPDEYVDVILFLAPFCGSGTTGVACKLFAPR